MNQDRIIISIPKPKIRLGSLRGWLPSKGNVAFTGIIVAALLFANRAGVLAAFVPAAPVASTTAIPYQGRLANAGGNPLTGTYSMVFRLYSQVSSGSPLWEETWTGPNGVRVSDGLFNVMLGSLTVIPQAVMTGNANLWLGITVGVDGEMAPRVQLGTVPFAMQALTVPDGSVSATKLAGSSVTNAALADLSVSTAKLVDGSVSSTKLLTSSVLTDKLADAAVSSNKLRPTSGAVGPTVDHSINVLQSYGNSPIPQTEFVFTLDRPSRVLIWYSAVAWATAPGEYGTFFRLTWPSGTTNHATSTFSGDQFRTYSSVALIDLPAGTYSGELRAYGSTVGATMTFAANRVYLNYLIMAQ